MNKPTRGPAVDRARVRELKAQGMSNTAIAARLGCARETVYQALKGESHEGRVFGRGDTGHEGP